MNNIKLKIRDKYDEFKKYLKGVSIKRYAFTNILFLTYIIVNLINSYLLRVLTMHDYFSIKAIVADMAFILILGSLAYLSKPKKQVRILMSLTVIMTLICLINSIYYSNYISFASVSLLSTSVFILDVGDAVVKTILQVKDVVFLLPPVILLIVHTILKKRKYYEKVEKIEHGKKRLLNTLIMGGIAMLLVIVTMVPSDYSRLKKQWNREYLVSRFGIYVYQANDIVKSVEPKFNSLFGFDSASKTFRDFYEQKAKEPKKTNEYTDIFKGKNVIIIHGESLMTESMALSFNGKEVTPNLNRIANEGLFFSNFYSQVSVGTSSDSEFTLNTSLLPVSSGTVFVNYWDRTYEALPLMLKQKGYYTASMHANSATFWNRNVMHKQLGYDKFYAKDSFTIDEKIGLGLSDMSFFRQSIPKLQDIKNNNSNFYVTMIMLSNHTPFDDVDKYGDFSVDYKTTQIDENGNDIEVVLPYMEGTDLGNYFKSTHYADGALNYFFEQLDASGLLDNTVVVIYGDHDAKLAKSEYEYFYNYNPETKETYKKGDAQYRDVNYYSYELNRKVPFIIWTKDSANNKKLNKNIDEVMGMYDVMPTLANMLGLDPKYALGKDIFNTNNNIVVFPNGNWLTDKMYYNAQKEEYLLIKDSVVNDGEIKNNKKYANKLLDVSDSLIIYDLLGEGSDENKKK
ncbi:MAG: LTA synthase family protein [Bacilli bacterium]